MQGVADKRVQGRAQVFCQFDASRSSTCLFVHFYRLLVDDPRIEDVNIDPGSDASSRNQLRYTLASIGFAMKYPLREIAAELLEQIPLLLRLNAFSDCLWIDLSGDSRARCQVSPAQARASLRSSRMSDRSSAR
jgi:hypothetical protein